MTKEFDPRKEQRDFQKKILTYEQAVTKIREAKERGLKIVLARGVFDVVHIEHVEYLRGARKAGDLLFVGVERDETVRLNKGEKRPFNSLPDRIDFLAEMESVDFVFGFTDVLRYGSDIERWTEQYRELNPNMIAVTDFDPNLEMKRKQAKKARVELVLISHRKRNSTTNLLNLIGYE